jgi:hypothetical protein
MAISMPARKSASRSGSDSAESATARTVKPSRRAPPAGEAMLEVQTSRLHPRTTGCLGDRRGAGAGCCSKPAASRSSSADLLAALATER